MSEISQPTEVDQRGPEGPWRRLPERLQPREQEQGGRGRLRRVEGTLLVLAFLVLAIATVNDLVRQVHINHRLTADIRTWRSLTGHHYHNLSVQQDLKGFTKREIVCGNTSPGPPGAKPQVCLIITGPVVQGVRSVHGGFYLPPYVQNIRANRYACFGVAAAHHICGLARPPGAPDAPVLGGS